MISKDSLKLDWINRVAAAQKPKADKILVEKMIRALLLLEGLAISGLSFVFKGGTAVMLSQQVARRFSIDIDIVVAKKIDFDAIFKKIVEDQGFTKFELHPRKGASKIEKFHYKFFYAPTHHTNTHEDKILLDILVENHCYKNLVEVPIASLFVMQERDPVIVRAPSTEDLLADKLTAFAPNTCGIPYAKNGDSRSMEIIKQLYDIAHLLESIGDSATVAETFGKIALKEMSYRELPGGHDAVLADIVDTALCLSTRGKAGKGDYAALEQGVSRVRSFIFSERYYIEKAIAHAAMAAYCANLIKSRERKLFKFENPDQIKGWSIEHPQLHKLRKSNPEAFFYWYHALGLSNRPTPAII